MPGNFCMKVKCNLTFCSSCVCDGVWNCRHGEDEAEFCKPVLPFPKPYCGKNEFECVSAPHELHCIKEGELCDGKKDCPAGEDEGTWCTTDLCRGYLCEDSSKCIKWHQICDGFQDCNMGDDEQDCAILPPANIDYSCTTKEFSCADHVHCAAITATCDGKRDCSDSSDENVCHVDVTKVSCKRGHFTCADGSRCLPLDKLCDGFKQCPDGSDEITVICKSFQYY